MANIEKCVIAKMLVAQKKHISFHTPGHKRSGADITELPYSDNLYSPRGVIAEAERDVAEILGAERSFLLTDGSTAGVFSMLYALKLSGAKTLALPEYSHPCVWHAMEVLGLSEVVVPQTKKDGIPVQPTLTELIPALDKADALLLTSPDYYGNFAPLSEVKAQCNLVGKPLLIDGAHGGHLHFTKSYAGRYADLWVDGVHKSLPALTQGAVVSAANLYWAQLLSKSVVCFRTTSPSYPILASVEYAVKYPRNLKIEQTATALKSALGAYANDDWTKLLVPFGNLSDAAEKYLENNGIYPEFNDGNYLLFYLSPCTKMSELKKLCTVLAKIPRGEIELDEEVQREKTEGRTHTVWVPLAEAAGCICAEDCGLFPPCIPIITRGELITDSIVDRLLKTKNTYGLKNGKIAVFED